MQIERDFYSFVKNSDLGKAIKGKVYRPEMRPANATTEDLIVKFLASLCPRYTSCRRPDGSRQEPHRQVGGAASRIRRNRRWYGILARNRYDTDDDAQRGNRAAFHIRKNQV